ncbi:lipid II flippase Amj family protein [Sporolactobacillus sp. STSJ-5]|uniref:lipid II flippase Amj family protein n=1 Tax=Sporolactobacillus sp. STSJ-5 TaxID=2965076 RepID=UPI002107429C|nr:lipid II flippase Amj family protein [Sporolactobacillus sp. STSJ-5]MCQ2008385.1 lipid II flippase Amj family protein [Sporolactobacillus sp. STSJ-5]
MSLITGRLMIIALLLLVVTMIETLAYSIRISGVRVKLMATAISLFSTIVLISRFSTMFQQPLTAKLIADAPAATKLMFIEEQYRILLIVVSIGVILGIVLFPTFIGVFSRAIIQLANERGSIVSLFAKWSNVKGMKRLISYVRLPHFKDLKGITYQTIPKRLFVINVVITAVYSVGILASLYASLLVPKDYGQAAVLSSGIINGIATILLTLFIDPKASVLADRVAKKESRYIYLKSYSLTMISSKLIGTLAAQAIFIPAAYYVAWFARLM